MYCLTVVRLIRVATAVDAVLLMFIAALMVAICLKIVISGSVGVAGGEGEGKGANMVAVAAAVTAVAVAEMLVVLATSM